VIAIGRGGNNTLIGVDGDGLNDENERNIFGGLLPFSPRWVFALDRVLWPGPGTNVVIAGITSASEWMAPPGSRTGRPS